MMEDAVYFQVEARNQMELGRRQDDREELIFFFMKNI